ncbi:MAG: OB-fold domain-containing protein [Burkholderiaceae bacterium]
MNHASHPVDKPHEQYFSFLQSGHFMIQHSPSTGQYVFYPRVAAPVSGAQDLVWVPASGDGVVYATTVMRPKPPQAPYNVALVELAEGPRMMSRIEGVPAAEVKIGMTVKARIAAEDAGPVVVFDVVGGAV